MTRRTSISRHARRGSSQRWSTALAVAVAAGTSRPLPCRSGAAREPRADEDVPPRRTPRSSAASRRASRRRRTATSRSRRRPTSTTPRCGRRSARRSTPILARSKALWIEGNPYYERVEGVVAGTPSLAVYDVILDAGSSAKEDPASAVPFDLRLADGRVLRKPGNLFNLTEGMLWGTRPEYTREGRSSRSRRRRQASSSARRSRTPPSSRPPPTAFALYAGEARPLGEGMEADRVGRVHGGRRDGADDERVLRPVEGLALRARRPRARATRSTSSRGSRTSATSSAGFASSTRGSGPRSPTVDHAAGGADEARARQPVVVRLEAARSRSGRDAASRPSRRTRSAARRRGARRRSPAR